jgi:hypothetical protein
LMSWDPDGWRRICVPQEQPRLSEERLGCANDGARHSELRRRPSL